MNVHTGLIGHLTLLAPRFSWDVVSEAVARPIPVDEEHSIAEETKALEAWGIQRSQPSMEFSFRVLDSVKSVLGNTQNPKIA